MTKTVVVFSLALSSVVLAKTPQAGKDLLRPLVQHTPWDMAKLAHYVKLDWTGLGIGNEDYVPDALNLIEELIVEILQQEKVQKLLLWQLTAPTGKQHYLLGTHHDLTLQYFSSSAHTSLTRLLEKVDVLIHEGIELRTPSLEIAAYSKFDDQVTAMAQQLGKKIMPLENKKELNQDINDYRSAKIVYKMTSEDENLTYLDNAAVEAKAAAVLAPLEESFKRQRAYLHADHAALIEFGKHITPELEIVYDSLLYVRNHRWLPRIVEQCEQDSTCLITAGHAHMTDDTDHTASIITLLREQGYAVEPISD